jgi:methylenetetrahydrofolate reductase (NADPH)
LKHKKNKVLKYADSKDDEEFLNQMRIDEHTPKEVYMFNYPYIVELLSPRRPIEGQSVDDHLDRFADRYQRIIDMGFGLSIPDNPMGQPRMGALESMGIKKIRLNPDKVVMNLNTFHTKEQLDGLLNDAAKANLKYILVIRGDGGPLLPKLDAKSIGGSRSVSTSIDLIRYINSNFPGQFITGAAYNPYKPVSFEMKRMEQKIDAGAKFAITQPIIGRDRSIDEMQSLNITVVIEAWMSKNIDLLYRSVGKEKDEMAEDYDPINNLKALHEFYPECCVYLSMLNFKLDWREILPL